MIFIDKFYFAWYLYVSTVESISPSSCHFIVFIYDVYIRRSRYFGKQGDDISLSGMPPNSEISTFVWHYLWHLKRYFADINNSPATAGTHLLRCRHYQPSQNASNSHGFIKTVAAGSPAIFSLHINCHYFSNTILYHAMREARHAWALMPWNKESSHYALFGELWIMACWPHIIAANRRQLLLRAIEQALIKLFIST